MAGITRCAAAAIGSGECPQWAEHVDLSAVRLDGPDAALPHDRFGPRCGHVLAAIYLFCGQAKSKNHVPCTP